ncbi:roadblock/LC7 domain-containing protein [Methanocaldococcus lauensis]|uniref:roadblock/LC7 domain-containing protein n=1 Tax=Methanocaldococcus lauensis TaxID=2546128 RepID=UPI00202797FE|nr:roadblock/LC7 domain-containing protein [Methanocaldococcus lauensis]
MGVLKGVGIYMYREREKRKTYKLIEMEIIENLKELKTYMDTENKEFSKEFDLVEIALTYDVGDIIVVNNEGLIIASTLKDAENAGAVCLGIFEYVKKFYNDIRKIILQRKDKYIYIYPIKLCGEMIYIIIESKVMLEIVDEKEILKKTCNVLKKYFSDFKTIDYPEKESYSENMLITS